MSRILFCVVVVVAAVVLAVVAAVVVAAVVVVAVVVAAAVVVGVVGAAVSKSACTWVADPALNLHVDAVEQTPTQRTNVEPELASACSWIRSW